MTIDHRWTQTMPTNDTNWHRWYLDREQHRSLHFLGHTSMALPCERDFAACLTLKENDERSVSNSTDLRATAGFFSSLTIEMLSSFPLTEATSIVLLFWYSLFNNRSRAWNCLTTTRRAKKESQGKESLTQVEKTAHEVGQCSMSQDGESTVLARRPNSPHCRERMPNDSHRCSRNSDGLPVEMSRWGRSIGGGGGVRRRRDDVRARC